MSFREYEAGAAIPSGPCIHLYARCSHEDSKVSQLGLMDQRYSAEAYARELMERHGGLSEGYLFEDQVVSAYKVPFVQRGAGWALHHVLKENDHVVFAKFDRAFRSMHDFCNMKLHWDKLNIKVHFVDLRIDASTAAGNAMLQTMAMMAELQSRLTSERCKAALAIKRSQGWVNKHVPRIGYRWHGKTQTYDMKEQNVFRKIEELRAEYPKDTYTETSDRLEKWLAEQEFRQPLPLFFRKYNPRLVRKRHEEWVILKKIEAVYGEFPPMPPLQLCDHLYEQGDYEMLDKILAAIPYPTERRSKWKNGERYKIRKKLNSPIDTEKISGIVEP